MFSSGGSGPVSSPKTAFLRSPQRAWRYPPVKIPAAPVGELCRREIPCPRSRRRTSPPVVIVRVVLHLPGRYPYCAHQRLGDLSKVSQSPLRLGYGGPRFALEK